MKLVLPLLMLFGACNPGGEVGGVELEGVDHMRGYLVRPDKWEHERRGDGQTLSWSFTIEGAFEVWADGSDDLEQWIGIGLPPGVMRARGRWTADTETLSLTDIVSGSAPRIVKASLPLAWVDGKLRIEIGGRRFFSHKD